MQPAIQQLEQPAEAPVPVPAPSQGAPARVPYFRPWELTHNVTVLPNAFMDYKGLSPTAKLVYATLVRYSHGKHYTYPKVHTIAAKLGIGESTVKRAIPKLVDEGFLERRRRGRKLSNLYFFLAHPALLGFKSPPPGNRVEVPPGQGARPPKVMGQNDPSLRGHFDPSTQFHHHQGVTDVRSPELGNVSPSSPAGSPTPPEEAPQHPQTPAGNGKVSQTPREAQAELVELVQHRTGEPFPQHALEEIQLALTRQGVPLAEFVLRLKPHLKNKLNNPVGFVRVFARKFKQWTCGVDLAAIERPRCHECGFPLGKGGKEQAGKIVACPTCQAYQRELGRRR